MADAVSAARKLPIAVVLPANDATRQSFPDAETIPAAPDTPVDVPDLAGLPGQLQRLTDEQYRSFIHALEFTEEPAQPATGAWKLSEDHAHTATTPLTGAHTVHLDGGGADPGNPFPALLASAAPGQRTEGTDEAEGPAGTDEAEGPAAAASMGCDQGGSGTNPAVPGQAARPQAPRTNDTEAEDPAAPEIRVLGPLQVSGVSGSGHGPKVGALAALVYLRPGRSADTLCTAMDPAHPWSTRTLQSRLSEIRSRFGTAADGQPHLPRPKNEYSFRPGIRSDWDRSQELATRGLAAGPDTGVPDLGNALGRSAASPSKARTTRGPTPSNRRLFPASSTSPTRSPPGSPKATTPTWTYPGTRSCAAWISTRRRKSPLPGLDGHRVGHRQHHRSPQSHLPPPASHPNLRHLP
ncbi:hypothetical protein ACK03K_19920 [[Kitasatospora] papulosa]|uniref:hypothetical protein n=1 Tax=[Kitasatospora] papulosa TaxID=1464011 RepID=UPI003907F65B